MPPKAESPGRLWSLATREVDGLRSAIAHALSHTAVAVEGEPGDLRQTLERLRDEADGVGRLVRRLGCAAAPPAGGRRVVHLPDVVDGALTGLPRSLAVVRTAEPSVPPVAGHEPQLTHMVLAVLAAGAGPGRVGVETSTREGALRGEWIVQIRIVDGRSPAPASEAELEAAAMIARDHGGFLATECAGAHGRVTTIDLPSV